MLGLLEAKTLLAFVMLKMSFELDLDPELENAELLSFGLGTQNDIHVKLNKLNF